MCKIFGYELWRIAVSWLFFGLLLVFGIFCWFVLSMDVIAGIADTAPFSVWSYLAYIGKTMNAAMVTVLLLLACRLFFGVSTGTSARAGRRAGICDEYDVGCG